MAKKIIRNYISLIFIIGLSEAFFFAVYQIFLAERGMDLLEINMINAFFMASVFIFEIPTGSFADIFGRKKSVVAGCFVLSLSFLIYFFSENFWIFVLAEIIAAFGKTLISGALEAWLVDSLKFHDFDGDIHDVFNKELQWKEISVIFGSLLGAWVGNFNIALPWLMTSMGLFLAGIFSSFKFKEEYFSRKKVSFNFDPMVVVAKESIAYGISNRAVFYIVAFEMIMMFSFQGFNMQWPFVFQKMGLDVFQLGMLFVAVSLFSIAGGQLSKKFGKMIGKEKETLIFSQAITFLGMMGAAIFSGIWPVMFWFLIHEGGRGMFKPLKQVYMNKRIESRKRATVLSFDSMVSRGGAFLGLVASGYLAREYSISLSWTFSGIVLGISILIFLRMRNGK